MSSISSCNAKFYYTCEICGKKEPPKQGNGLQSEWYKHKPTTTEDLEQLPAHTFHADCVPKVHFIAGECPICSPQKQSTSFLQSKAPKYIGDVAGTVVATTVMPYLAQVLGVEATDILRGVATGVILGATASGALGFLKGSFLAGRSAWKGKVHNLSHLVEKLAIKTLYHTFKVGIVGLSIGVSLGTAYAPGLKIWYLNQETDLSWIHHVLSIPIGAAAVAFIGSATAATSFLAYQAASRATKFIGKLIF